jgi:hypothetical protein
MSEEPTQRRVPLGEPLSDEELERLAEITDDDIAEAGRWWLRHAPRGVRSLLDATEDEDA